MCYSSSIINIILRIVKLCFSSGDFLASCCKSAIIPLYIKKILVISYVLFTNILKINVLKQNVLCLDIKV